MNKIGTKLSQLLALTLALGGCAMEPLTPEEEIELQESALSGSSNLHAFGVVSSSGVLSATRRHGIHSVARLAAGRYRVSIKHPTWKDFGFGNFQVVALGSSSNRCKFESWGPPSLETLRIDAFVRCHDTAGTLRDESFSVNYVGNLGRATQPAAYLNGGGSPAVVDGSFNSGGAVSLTRSAAGDYSATFSGLALNGGTVQVSAIGTNTRHCKVSNWFASGSSTIARVLCFNGASLADSKFSLNLDAFVSTPFDRGARAWADQPSTALNATYTPAAAWSLNTGSIIDNPGSNVASRTGTGVYSMRHTKVGGEPSGVHVTAYGTGSQYCKLGAWSISANGDVVVTTRCFSSTGAVANSQYVETFQVALVRGPS